MSVKSLRPIVTIDESKCNGCGLCITACAEGALQLVDGKAKLVNEVYCDGLGACLGECPQGAITVEEREARAFDEAAVEKHLTMQKLASIQPHSQAPSGCLGAMARSLRPVRVPNQTASAPVVDQKPAQESALQNWPVQLMLLPINAPYLHQANLLISADCVPFALPDFHSRFLANRTLAVGCPKLDDAQYYRAKLAELFKHNEIATVQVLYMEVPCCSGLVCIVQGALADAEVHIPLELIRIGIQGEILDTQKFAS